MNRYVGIHGHFYQLPRENPWLEAIELQDSAFLCHDRNERIMTECYAPNTAAARLLDDPDNMALLENLESMIDLLALFPFEVDLWRGQNLYYRMLLKPSIPIN